MTLRLATKHALLNPVKSLGRNSISRFGSILTNGSVSFKGWNQYKTHPLQARFGANSKSVHIHSELDCIIQAVRWLGKTRGSSYPDVADLSEFSLYVSRVIKNGTPMIAKPCSGCQRAITAFNIQHVEWTK